MGDRSRCSSKRAWEESEVIVLQLLSYEPTTKTRNRKPLRPNEVAEWELRIGKFRVLYDVDENGRIVRIKVVGFKIGNLLFVRGRKKEL